MIRERLLQATYNRGPSRHLVTVVGAFLALAFLAACGSPQGAEPVGTGTVLGNFTVVPPLVADAEVEVEAMSLEVVTSASLLTSAGGRPDLPDPNLVMVLLGPRGDEPGLVDKELGVGAAGAGSVEALFASVTESAQAVARQYGFAGATVYAPEVGFAVFAPEPGTDVRVAVQALSADLRVRAAAPVTWVQPTTTPDDPYFVAQWSFDVTDAPVGWNYGTGSSDVVVAVVDSGVAGPVGWTNTPGVHPDLLRNLLPGYDFVSGLDLIAELVPPEEESPPVGEPDAEGGDDEVGEPVPPEVDRVVAEFLDLVDVVPALRYLDADTERGWDPFPVEEYGLTDDLQLDTFGGHGLHVAGLVGAAGNDGRGVTGGNWDVSILPLRAIGTVGGLTSDVLAAVLYAAGVTVYDPVTLEPLINPHPADIINLSLGGSGGDAVSKAVYSHVYEDLDVLVVAAAGNSGRNLGEQPYYPASYPGVMAVSSVDYVVDAGGRPEAAFSYLFSNYGDDVELSAPGGFCWADARAYVTVDLGRLCDESFVLSAGWRWFAEEPAVAGALVRIDEPVWFFTVGTSMAAPQVSAAAALALSIDPSLSAKELRALLTDTARRVDDSDLGRFGRPAEARDAYYGAGVVDLAAIARAASTGVVERATRNVTVRAIHESGEEFDAVVASSTDFAVAGLPAGTYSVVAGIDSDGDGVLGGSGEYYGESDGPVVVDGREDVTGIELELRRVP